ncbi:MAG: hypothetical protein HY547_09130 [Elusimicrobia bacterium]|nr:hypothetical protein [Elusimicrobiota bacterium]
MLARLILKLIAVLLLVAGYLFINNPTKIHEIVTSLRDSIFNDAYLRLHRRRIGNVLIVIGVILMAVAWFGR